MTIAQNSNQIIANSGSMAGAQTDSKVAKLANGGFVVAWTSTVTGDPNGGNVQYRLFDANGNPSGAIQLASTQITNNEKLQDIIANSDGSFTIAFTSTGASGTAPVGYGATGTLETIGIVRSFNGTGVAQGLESKVFITGTHDSIDSMKLVNAGASSNFVYFGQSNNADTLGTLYKSASVSTTGPGTTLTATILKTYTSNVVIDNLSSHSATSDALYVNGTRFFSDNPSSVVVDTFGATFVEVAEGLVLRFQPFSTGLSAESFSGSGNTMANYVSMGTSSINIFGSSSGTATKEIQVESLGNGRFFVAFAADVSGGGGRGIYGSVFNANSFSFETTNANFLMGAGLAGQPTRFDLDVLTDGRIVVTTPLNKGFVGGIETIVAIFDANDLTTAADSDATYSFVKDTAGVLVDLQNSTFNTGQAANVSTQFFPNIIGGSGADRISGDSNGNIFKGGAGDDFLDGRTGNDLLFGDIGNDTLLGRGGNDQIKGGVGSDYLHGGANDDILLGDADADRLYGGTGEDRLEGGDGDDLLSGDGQNDWLDGGAGNDRIYGGLDDDIIFGGIGNDVIYDGDGADEVDAGAGNDTVVSGIGADFLNGGANTDTIDYSKRGDFGSPGFAGFVIELDSTFEFDVALPVNSIREDLLTGFENATGSSGADVIVGSTVVNVLRGGSGDDLIYSRAGADIVIGGAGADRFYFGATNEGLDQIRDFETGIDNIMILSSAFGEINGSNIAAQFSANSTGTAAANALPQFILDNSGTGIGELRYDADGNGAGASVIIAKLTFTTGTGLSTFGVNDFEFV